jgi:pimeloyl-ACP methyl ester carboxylesterase
MRRSALPLIGATLLAAAVVASLEASQPAQPWRDPSPHQVRWVTVDSSVRVEVLDWGGSGPPVVLRGCYLSAHVYDEFAPKLTSQFRVYGITRRGIGASDRPATGYAVQRSADDLREVLDALGLQKSLVLGTSCAGQVQTVFASQHPDRLFGLIYLDGASDPTRRPLNTIRRCRTSRRCRVRPRRWPTSTPVRSRPIGWRSDARAALRFPKRNSATASPPGRTAR